MELEVCTLIYVRSLTEATIAMYLDTSTELVPWFFALEYINYARWIPVHLKDMAELAKKHPDIYREFSAGHFTVRKPNECSHQFPLIERMNRTMCVSRAMRSSWPHRKPKCPSVVDGCRTRSC